MAFDGITIAAMVQELHRNLDGGRFNRRLHSRRQIELLITGKGANGQCRLLLSAERSPSLLIYFTSKNKPSPDDMRRIFLGTASEEAYRQCKDFRYTEAAGTGTCGRSLSWSICNELGDPCKKVLIMELMGKHSNIIFCDDKNMILDSIKHVSSHMSSVREVLPGREYFIPQTQDKLDPLTVDEETFIEVVCKKPCNISRAIYSSLTGNQSCCCGGSLVPGLLWMEVMRRRLWTRRHRCICYHTFCRLMDQVREGDFTPILFTVGKSLWNTEFLLLQQYGPEYHSVEFGKCFRNAGDLLCDKEYTDPYSPEIFGSEENRADCAGA